MGFLFVLSDCAQGCSVSCLMALVACCWHRCLTAVDNPQTIPKSPRPRSRTQETAHRPRRSNFVWWRRKLVRPARDRPDGKENERRQRRMENRNRIGQRRLVSIVLRFAQAQTNDRFVQRIHDIPTRRRPLHRTSHAPLSTNQPPPSNPATPRPSPHHLRHPLQHNPPHRRRNIHDHLRPNGTGPRLAHLQGAWTAEGAVGCECGCQDGFGDA